MPSPPTDPVAHFLRRLQEELQKNLPEEDLQARLQEAQSHLGEWVEARCELGGDRRIAEQEAVAAFGSTRAMARRWIALRRRRRHGLWLALVTLAGLAVLGSAVATLDSGPLPLLASGAAFGGIACGLMGASQVKPPWRSLLASTVAFWSLGTTIFVVEGTEYGGFPMSRRNAAQIERYYDNWERILARREAKHAADGWPSERLRAQTVRDHAFFTARASDARAAARSLNLVQSARWLAWLALGFFAYLLLLSEGAALVGRYPRWGRWDFWRPE